MSVDHVQNKKKLKTLDLLSFEQVLMDQTELKSRLYIYNSSALLKDLSLVIFKAERGEGIWV